MEPDSLEAAAGHREKTRSFQHLQAGQDKVRILNSMISERTHTMRDIQ